MSDRMLSDEILLGIINSKSGGGGGGTDDYNKLKNQPKINNNTLVGNKTASDLGLVAAETGKGLSTNDYTNEDKAIVGGVTAALAEKQDALTAGNYVSITNNGTINVTQGIGVYDAYSYELMSTGVGITIQLTKKINNVTISTQEIRNEYYSPTNKLTVDGLFELWYDMSNFYWHYKLLVDSEEHQKNEDINWYYRTMADYTETFNVSQDSSTDLATKGDVNSAINDIKDGTSIDSFADVETALALKQDKTDNNLQTTDKTVVGAVNELKSGLINVNTALDVPENTGKNLIPLTLDNIKHANTSGTWSGNDYVINGVTYTVVLTNGVVTSITASGTASANADFYCSDFNTLKAGSYVLNGCASNGSEATYFMLCGEATARLATDTGNGNAFTINADKSARTAIRVYSGYEITGTLTFYPMIRPATITDPTFAPYIPSVESRIEAVENGLTNQGGNITLATNVTNDTVDYSIISRMGNVVTVFVSLVIDDSISAWNKLADLSAGFRPIHTTMVVGWMTTTSEPCLVRIGNDGSIMISKAVSAGKVQFSASYIVN